MTARTREDSAESGLSVLELVIVMLVLAILAVVALPKLQDMIAAAEESVEKATVAAIKTGLELLKYKEAAG